jgi:cyclophilin family peptidyl-prolyl cis-trans isomerase
MLWSLLLVLPCVLAGEYTVTQEAWFEVEVADIDGPGTSYSGRFVIALFGETAPMTVLNFASIAQGYQRGEETKLHYKNTTIHRIVPDFVIQMGDVTVGDGTGSRSIYGDTFIDENFELSHRAPGWVSMANRGKDTNGSQFFILLSKARWLDGKHVVFGKVIRGFDTVRTIGELATNPKTAQPELEVRIVDCGVDRLDRKYDLKPEDLDSTDDLL